MMAGLMQQSNGNLVYLRQAHGGVSKARNLGIGHARADLIAFTEDDCVIPKEWIEKIIYFHKKYPNQVAIQGKILNYYHNNLIAILEQRINAAYLDYILYDTDGNKYITLFYTGNCSVKIKFFKEWNVVFNERFLTCEDVDLSNQLAEKGIKILYTEEITVMHKYRSNIISFIGKHFRDGRWRYTLKLTWHKNERSYNTKEISSLEFYLKMSLEYLQDYTLRGTVLALLHILRKFARILGYAYQKALSGDGLSYKRI
jgi:GT2 family glycosyltransferase